MWSCATQKERITEASVYLTFGLYEVVENSDGNLSLIIDTKKFPVGELKFTAHREFKIPKSIRIKKKQVYRFGLFATTTLLLEEELLSDKEALKIFKEILEEELGVQIFC